MSTITAGTTSGTALQQAGDTTGTLVFKTNDSGSGGTTALTLGTDQSATFAGGIVPSGSTAPTNGMYLPAANTLGFATNSTQVAKIDSSGVLSFNSGFGSVAAAYGCRAWVNFNGTGTVAIRASANVSSITDNGTGDYTVNFTTAMTDANYSVAYSCAMYDTNNNSSTVLIYGTLATGASGKTSSALRIKTGQPQTTTFHDNAEVNVSIFR